MFFGLIALIYYACFLLLVGLVLFIAIKGRRTRVRLRRIFFLLAFSLLVWQLTLFLEIRMTLPTAQLWLGRMNFTAIVFAAYFALRFVQEVAGKGSIQRSAWSFWLLAETGLVAVLTLFTPFIDAVERVDTGQAITTYGILFPVYLLHILSYLGASLVLAFRERHRAENPRVRRQLTFIGLGMLATGSTAVVTNVVLPYSFGDFRFCDVGTLSTLCFILAVAYATLIHGLFDLRFVLRETVVYGFMLVLVLSTYSSLVFLITQYFTDGKDKATQFAVIVIACSFDPIRRLLEAKTDRLLFGDREIQDTGKKRRRR